MNITWDILLILFLYIYFKSDITTKYRVVTIREVDPSLPRGTLKLLVYLIDIGNNRFYRALTSLVESIYKNTNSIRFGYDY